MCIYEFTAERYSVFYIWQVIIPLVFIVAMSWTAFWNDPTNAGTQIAIATSSMLTLIAYRFMLSNLTPRLADMTRMDYFTFGSTTLVFLTLLETVATASLAKADMPRIARNVDRLSMVAFPATFILWSIWSLAFA